MLFRSKNKNKNSRALPTGQYFKARGELLRPPFVIMTHLKSANFKALLTKLTEASFRLTEVLFTQIRVPFRHFSYFVF